MPRLRKKAEPPVSEELPIRSPARKRKRVDYAEDDSDAAINPANGISEEEEQKTPPKKTKITKAVKQESVVESPRGKKTTKSASQTKPKDTTPLPASADAQNSKPVSKSKKKVEVEPEEVVEAAAESENPEDAKTNKMSRKRKTKEEKEAEAMPLAARTTGLRMFVGAHTSVAKGVENAVHNCVHIGGNAFAMFLKSQRKWDNPALKDENRDAFKQALTDHNYDGLSHVVPHGSYLVNLATEDKDKSKQSYDAFLDDLKRCEALGIKHYNFHPGAAGQSTMSEAIGRLANKLNKALSETSTVIPLLENMATRGTVIGGKFSDLRDIIAKIKPEYQSRIGVCIDTCHTFASGYDLRTPEAFQKTLEEFDKTVGMKYLKALHLNDSKAPFASNRDLHQNIGLGFLGLRAFHNVMNEPRFDNLPLILETPSEKPDPNDKSGKKTLEDKSVWAKEIKLLESLINMDPEGEEFKSLEKELSDKGKAERQKMQKTFDDKVAKDTKKAAKEREKGQKSVKDMFGKKKGKKDDSAGSGSELSEPEE